MWIQIKDSLYNITNLQEIYVEEDKIVLVFPDNYINLLKSNYSDQEWETILSFFKSELIFKLRGYMVI